MDRNEKALELHRQWKGKIRVTTPCKLEDREDLSLAYTPGVAAPCLEIQKDVEKSYEYTRRGNLVAVVTDGTAVLGLGDIGPEAGMPVMEGKCALFQAFAGVDAFPLCVRSKDVDEIVHAVELIAGSFGGINLEDIAAPRCFEVERKLKEKLDIPVFHDDQHGTAVVTVAAMLNALKLVGKEIGEVKAVVNGAGAAGTACTKLLMALGLKNVVVCDKIGALVPGLPGMTGAQAQLAEETNPQRQSGALADVIKGADVFLGFSAPGVLTGDMVRTMAQDPVIFACANPTPEIFPEEALAAGGAGGGHRPVRLPQPDQQRAGVPRHLPGRPGRPRPGHQRRYEGGGGQGHRQPHPRKRAAGGQHHPLRLRPPGGPGGSRRRGPGRP